MGSWKHPGLNYWLESMSSLIDGIYWGLFLAALIGPVLFILVQVGIERGFRAGATIGCGMWTSDLLFVLLSYFGLSYLLVVTELPGFEPVMGVVAGSALIGLGVMTLLSAPAACDRQVALSGNYFSLWLKGFMVNTLNPFTVFFWIMIATVIVPDNNDTGSEAVSFFAGIVLTVIATDCLKVYLARGLRKWLTFEHVKLVRSFVSFLLMVVGLGFLFRVLL